MANFAFDGHKLTYHLPRVSRFLEKGDVFPIYIEISPVGRCNHRCVFCAYDFIGYPNRKLETARTLSFIKELAASGVKSVLFAGEGEPLLHPDIVKFIQQSSKSGIDVGLFTNGQLFTEKTAGQILPFLTFVRFSFNAGTPENYAAIHRVRKEIFGTVLANMKTAARIRKEKKLKVDMGVQFVVIPENVDSLTLAAEAVKKAGMDYLSLKPFVHQSHRQSYSNAEPLTPLQIEKALTSAEKISEKGFQVMARRQAFTDYGKRNYSHCYGTSFITALNSAGDLATCLPYWDDKNFVFGNIFKSSFKKIWTGNKRKKIRKFLEQKLDVMGQCPPNCRPNQINEFLFELKHPNVKHINFI